MGFSRGSGVVGAGRMRCTPSEEDLTSQVERSWLMRACAASRAVAARASSSAAGGTGLGSLARRLPRSKVKGVGLVTVMGLEKSQRMLSCGIRGSHNLLVAVESASDAATSNMGDLTSMAPPLISSASCDCVGDPPFKATPPSISVSDILAKLWLCRGRKSREDRIS